MILGTGIDIIEVDRIRKSHEKFGDRFLKRILLPAEIEYCLTHIDPAPHLAARYAAKEAIGKMFGTGIGAQFGWQDAEVGRLDSGKSFVILHKKGKLLMSEIGGSKCHLSLSHAQDYATAIAVLER